MHCDSNNLCEASVIYVEVCAIEDAPAFICGVCGHVTVDMLREVEEDALDEELALASLGEGVHTFSVMRIEEQKGDYGRVEVAAYWDLVHVNSRPL